jgi:hypothetical protein
LVNTNRIEALIVSGFDALILSGESSMSNEKTSEERALLRELAERVAQGAHALAVENGRVLPPISHAEREQHGRIIETLQKEQGKSCVRCNTLH